MGSLAPLVLIFSGSRLFVCRRSEEEVDMDKVTAAMVLTSLSTSPLVRSPPVKVNGESLKHPAIRPAFSPKDGSEPRQTLTSLLFDFN